MEELHAGHLQPDAVLTKNFRRLCNRWKYDKPNNFNQKIMEERLIEAPIDEENIKSDWIEEIFDCCCSGGRNGNVIVGFVGNCVVTCEYHKNILTWKVGNEFNSGRDRIDSYDELKQRLKDSDKDDVNVVVKYLTEKEKVTLIQQFYFNYG